MSLEERVYSVLVVSAIEKFNSALLSILSESPFYLVHFASNVSEAKRTVAERSFDFIIINSPLPDDPGLRFAIDLCASKGTVVLLFIRTDVYDETHAKVTQHGVFTLQKPTSKQNILQALSWMVSTRERLRKFEKKTLTIEEKIEEIRLVNRAKWLLIRELHMDEPQAHRYIEKQAMDRCISRRALAEELIKTYS